MTSPSSSSSSSPISFTCLTQALKLYVAEFLSPRDLLAYQSTCREMAQLPTNAHWRALCRQRWEPWPRYRLTTAREQDLLLESSSSSSLAGGNTWKQRYWTVERDATRTTLYESDLHQLDWYLSFVLSGIRGEGRSDHCRVVFEQESQTMLVPGFPPLPYRIVNEPPPAHASQTMIRLSLRGDQPFSTTQWLDINSFPCHFISRKKSNAEWLIVNQNVVIVSCKPDD